MKKQYESLLFGFVPLPVGWLLVKLTAFLLHGERNAFLLAILDALEVVPVLLFWLMTFAGHRSRRTTHSTGLALLLFLLPAAIFSFLPGKLSACFYYAVKADFFGLVPTFWQHRLFAILSLGFAFWLGRRLLDLGEVNTYYHLVLVRLGIIMLRHYSQYLSGENTDLLLGPMLAIAGVPVGILQIKASFNILKALFHKRQV